MRAGLALRVVVLGVVVIAFLTVEFALVLVAFQSVRSATAHEEQADQAVIAASRVEKLVLDLETGTRGYVITADRRFLQPYDAARAALPGAQAQLAHEVPDTRPAAIGRAWRAYLRDYAQPLIALVPRNPKAAGSRLATGEGKRRVDELRHLIDPLIAERLSAAAGDRGRVASRQHEGVVIAAFGIGITILLFAGLVAYVVRAGVLPLRRLASATRDVAAGRVVEVPEGAPGELGELTAAFNEMSRTLAQTQASLADQNADLERLAYLLRAVLDSALDGILLSDGTGGVQLANRPMVEFARELGMTMGGNVVDNLLSIAERTTEPYAYRETMERLRAAGDEDTFDEFELADTGRVFQGFTSPVRDPRGGYVGRIWTLREVTHQRELDRLKDDFVATVSHELRTPLTSLMGFVEMLREGEAGELNPEQERFLEIVYRSSERLQRLVGDLLFVARLDMGGIQLAPGEVELHAVARDCAETIGAWARSREVELATELAALPPLVGDRERLAQVISNLLSNAVKFTPSGGRVTIRTALEDAAAVLEVADTGIGVPLEEQPRLFERFFRASSATEQAIPGTGLGLVIAKAIVEAHGGSIGVRSELGAGTCFRVTFPLDGNGLRG